MAKLINFLLVAAGALVLVLSPLLSVPASACGGFWCSASAPVNQSAEQIVFVDNPDGTVSTIVQIQYVGPSERFAWVIPITGVPEIEVSSNMALQRLDQATAPQYTLEREIEGMCMEEPFRGFPGAFDGAAGAESAPAPTAMGPVSVEAQGSVGPYDYVVISLDPSLEEPADVAIEWFVDNGYDLTSLDSEVLGPYLADGLNLLAFRLTKGTMVGAIRPVILTYESELPMIPLRPTAVAAQNDMGLQVWVAGQSQSIPQNYRSLVLNEALINWFNFRQNYSDVVTAAANEAGGQGFATELAQPMDEYKEVVFSSFDKQQWMNLMSQTFADGIDAIWAANNNGYRGWDGWRETIEASVTLPEGTDINDFARNPDAYRGVAEVDTNEFFQNLYENVVKPVMHTQELLNSRPYLTRMFSTMSADEMTVDPAFAFNSDLAHVSNQHVAKQFIECSPEVTVSQAPWRIELPQGGVIVGEGTPFAWPVELDAMPANLKVVQLTESGSGTVVEDNSGPISDLLFTQAGTMGTGEAIPDPPDDGVMIGGDQVVSLEPREGDKGMPEVIDRDLMMKSKGGDGGLCSVGDPGASGSTGALLFAASALLALGARRRRC